MPAFGGTQQEAWLFIRELIRRHRGEVRELRGCWEPLDGPVPQEMMNPQFDGSFIRPRFAIHRGRLASGSWYGSSPRSGTIEIRIARVFGLADLFAALGESFTAAELYTYYNTCRIIAKRQKRGQQAWLW